MAAVLQIEGTEASLGALQNEAMLLSGLLAAQPDLVVARPEEAPIEPGQRGAVLEVGKLLLSFVAPGGVETLIEGLKLYVARSPEFTIAVTGESGAKIEVTARNMSPDRIVETAGQLRALLAPQP
jgi:hypothetical protein